MEVCFRDSAYILTSIFLQLQSHSEDEVDPDPSLRVHFASADEIHNCLLLPTISTVGPSNRVPRLVTGIGSICMYNIER